MRKTIHLVLLCLLVAACQKADLGGLQNLSGDRIHILGHGGVGFSTATRALPPNSRESILRAVEGWNADGVDVDVHMGADSVLWLYHDPRLATQTNCQGCIFQKTEQELVDCRYRRANGIHWGQDGGLVKLEEIVERWRERPFPPYLYLDLREPIDCPLTEDAELFFSRMARALKRLVLRYNEEKVLIEADNSLLVRQLLQQMPNAKIVYGGFFDQTIETLIANGALFGLVFNFKGPSASQIKEWHQRGLRIVLWDVRIRSAAIEAAEKSPDFIISDNIPLLQEVIR
ncbi:MAG: glycerophosphodiester phosphodiesterase [Bacteroidota bacterium]